MSYSQASSSVTATNPIRRSTGLIFVVALHIVAIWAIKSGLIVPIDNPSIPHVHVIPNVEHPQPPPIDPVKLNLSTNIKITMPVPTLPITEIAPTNESPTEMSRANQNNEAGRAESTVVTARVDPTHPLTQPAYPAASRRANEEGRVELMLYILADGKVGEARIAQSSGHPRLDDSAQREVMRSWRFIPQQVDGVAAASWQRFAITFRLKN